MENYCTQKGKKGKKRLSDHLIITWLPLNPLLGWLVLLSPYAVIQAMQATYPWLQYAYKNNKYSGTICTAKALLRKTDTPLRKK